MMIKYVDIIYMKFVIQTAGEREPYVVVSFLRLPSSDTTLSADYVRLRLYVSMHRVPTVI